METSGVEQIFVEDWEVNKEDKERNLKILVEKVIELCKEASLTYPPECYNFVERCLRVKNYDVKKTAVLLIRFQAAMKDVKHLLAKHDPEKCAMVHTNGIITVLKAPDDFGRKVILFRAGEWHPKDIHCDEAVTTTILFSLWNVGESKALQRNGIVAIFDLKKMGIEQMRGASIKTLTKFICLLNDSAPLKIKGIHFIHHPKIFGPLFSLLKPFFKEKLSGRIHFHGDSTSSLQQFFKPEILPESLGGKLGEVEAADGESVKRFITDQSYCSELIRLGFPNK